MHWRVHVTHAHSMIHALNLRTYIRVYMRPRLFRGMKSIRIHTLVLAYRRSALPSPLRCILFPRILICSLDKARNLLTIGNSDVGSDQFFSRVSPGARRYQYKQ